MPTYEYKCPECSTYTTRVYSMKYSDTPVQCERCDILMKKIIRSAPEIKMGKSCFVKKPSANEQRRSEAIMEDYKARARGDLQ